MQFYFGDWMFELLVLFEPHRSAVPPDPLMGLDHTVIVKWGAMAGVRIVTIYFLDWSLV